MKRNNLLGLFLILLATSVFADDSAAPTQAKKKLTLQDLLGSSTSSYAHPTTVAGVRGLEETGAGVDTKARDFAAIDRLDKMVIPPAELDTFVAEGKLK